MYGRKYLRGHGIPTYALSLDLNAAGPFIDHPPLANTVLVDAASFQRHFRRCSRYQSLAVIGPLLPAYHYQGNMDATHAPHHTSSFQKYSKKYNIGSRSGGSLGTEVRPTPQYGCRSSPTKEGAQLFSPSHACSLSNLLQQRLADTSF